MKIERYREDNYDHLFQMLDGDNLPITLTTESFEITINSTENPTTIDDQLYQASGSIIDAATGTISFPIAGTTPVGEHFFDIQMIDTAGRRRTLVKGEWNVTQELNKNT